MLSPFPFLHYLLSLHSSQLGTLLTPLQTAHAPVTSTPQDVASRDLASGMGPVLSETLDSGW